MLNVYEDFMCSYLAPAIPWDLCVFTDLSCAVSCPKVRSHPLWQEGKHLCTVPMRWHMPHGKVPGHCRVPASSRAAEFHMCGKHHTVLWLRLGMDSLPGGHLPGSPGIATCSHLWPGSTLPQQCGGSAMSWAQSWMGKATCAGPQVTNCCSQVFLLSGNVLTSFLKVNMSVYFHNLAYIWFIFPVLFLQVSYLISVPFLLSLYCLW